MPVDQILLKCAEPTLMAHEFSGHESLGQPFDYRVVGLTPKSSVPMRKLVGSTATVQLVRPDGGSRFFNGVVARVVALPPVGRMHAYELTLRPWLWLLSRRADCRIYQDKTVVEIIKEVFAGCTQLAFDVDLSSSYLSWPYCVQYRETDFNFVQRLLEQEGMYYYFRHEDDRHTMVIVDDSMHLPDAPGCDKLPFSPHTGGGHIGREAIHEWTYSEQLESGAFRHTDYDFEKPSSDLVTQARNALPYAHGDREIYDYPGEYTRPGEGERFARVRLEAQQVGVRSSDGQTSAHGLAAGTHFSIAGHPSEEQNGRHLVVMTQIHVSQATHESGDAEVSFECGFSAIPERVPFRPMRLAYKPLVQGLQTAVVVGPSGEEIHTDKYGRVKVQFHWDRLGKKDENTSCWLRVAQPAAGKGFGFISIPRIGQEVVVDFLEGDPDQPIVNGCVYNAEQMPPYPLPDNKTHSGWRTHSSKGGGVDNFNELRFEDKKGSEYVWVQAEKTWYRLVKEDAYEEIRNDEHSTIDRDRTWKIGRDSIGKIGRDRMTEIGGDAHASIGGEAITRIGTVADLVVGSNLSIDAGGNWSLNAGGRSDLKTGANFAVDAGMNVHVKAGMNLVIEAGAQITIKAGPGSIIIGPDGVSITGPMVRINSGGSPGSGSGASPKSPASPKAPVDATKPADPLG